MVLNGYPVILSELIPEFRQRVKVEESDCSDCSSHVLSEMNEYLLNMFGQERFTYVLFGKHLCMHPNTFKVLKQKLNEGV